MDTIGLTIAYDGTAFHGWQRQDGERTVQGTLEAVMEKVTGVPVRLTGASRTDAGVHARGQFAHFTTDSPIPVDKWPYVLNPLLPEDVKVQAASRMREGFHARFDTCGKQYVYQILAQRQPSPLSRNRAFHVFLSLDVSRMRNAAAMLVGPHDFAAFRDVGCGAETTSRTLVRLDIREQCPFLTLQFEGDAFLYHMVRILSGTLVDVGTGRIPLERIPLLLSGGDRRMAGQTAPACGLTLEKVLYPNDVFLP